MPNFAAAEEKDINYFYSYFSDVTDSVFFYCNPSCPNRERFISFTQEEITARYEDIMKEININCSLSVLAHLEAVFRIDYITRSKNKKMKDPLSISLREIYKKKKHKASLEDDILYAWKNNESPRRIFSDLIGAMKFRHWIAHGRYWDQSLARMYDFVSIYSLAETIIDNFQLSNLPM